MGLYDREYTRHGESDFGSGTGGGFGSTLGASKRSITTILIVINVAAYLLNLLFRPIGEDGQRISVLLEWMAVHPDTLTRPWMWWQFLTYGFAHNDGDIMHLGVNMLVLFFFGNTVEQQLGRNEFLRFYLVAIVIGGLVWGIRAAVMDFGPNTLVIGASGGVQAVTILFAFLFPHATILLFFVVPVKAWMAAVGFAVINVLGALSGEGTTAYDVHLAGMGFAAVYFLQKLNLGRWIPAWLTGLPSVPRRRPHLRLHDPDKQAKKNEAEADRILEKIHREGEASLTRGERKFMEKYSRQKRAQRGD